MGIRSDKETYVVLEKYLRKADRPLTVTELLDINEVRIAAKEDFGPDPRRVADKVSDALGLMWRNNLLTRYPAPVQANSLARYAYSWADQKPKTVLPFPPSLLSTKKSGLVITEEDDGVRIEFEKFTVFVKPR